jgi:hypothetical protein
MVDGPAWCSRPTVTDREGSPLLLKQIMNWPVVARVWLPGWQRDREGTLHRLLDLVANTPLPTHDAQTATLKEIMDADKTGTDESGAHETVTNPSSSAIDGAESEVPRAFVPADCSVVASQYQLDNMQSAYPLVQQLAREALAIEGPIHIDRLVGIVSKKCGYSRIGAQKRANLTSMIVRGFGIDSDRFVWPLGTDPLQWREVRRTLSSKDRSVNEVSPLEILNAMEQMLRESLSSERDELVTETARLLGYERLGDASKELLLTALARGLTEHRFIKTDDRLRLP